MDYLDPEIWMTLVQAAEKWGCHRNTVYRNWPKVPKEERLRHNGALYIWRHTKFRPQRGSGHPPVTYYGMTKKKRVRDAYPNMPTDLSALPPQKREIWLALIDAAVESPPESGG